MTDAVKAFSLACTANLAPGLVNFVDCPLGNETEVTRILVVFPPGCNGNVGARIESGGSPVYPLLAGAFFIFDDYTLEIDPTNQVTTGQWRLAAYNHDFYVHTLQVYFFYNYLNLGMTGHDSVLVSLGG